MHLLVSKIIRYFVVPSNVVASLAVLGLILLAFRLPLRGAVSAFAAVALVATALFPLGNMLLTPLEQRFPEMRFPRHGIDGIIVLGGSYDSQSHSYLSTIVLEEDTEPMAVMVDLARRYPNAKIVFSGGTDPSSPGPSEAAVVRDYFISFGIAADRISIEGRSLTTEQNAQFTAAMIHPTPQSRWLLVTSSYHMPRAMGAFRKAGFNVLAFSVGSRTHGWQGMWWPSATAADNIRRFDVAAHEWLGLLDYKLSGYSNEWFAGPDPVGG